MSHGNLYDAPLALLTEDAYAGFDDRVAEIQGEAVEIVSHEVELA